MWQKKNIFFLNNFVHYVHDGALLKPCTAPHRTAPHRLKPCTALTEISVKCRVNSELYRTHVICYLYIQICSCVSLWEWIMNLLINIYFMSNLCQRKYFSISTYTLHIHLPTLNKSYLILSYLILSYRITFSMFFFFFCKQTLNFNTLNIFCACIIIWQISIILS